MTIADDASAGPLEWEPWWPPDVEDVNEDGFHGYGHLARYVVPAAIEDYRSVFPSDVRETAAREGVTGVELERQVTLRLFDLLKAREIRYAAPPWTDDGAQWIRDPGYLLGPDANGTCLDLAVLFEAACLSAGLDAFLVVLRQGSAGHAGVGVRLRRRLAATDHVLRPVGGGDVLEVLAPRSLADDDDWLFVDPTHATYESGGDGTLRLPDEADIHLVSCRDEKQRFQLPETRGALRQRVPAPDPLRHTIGMVRMAPADAPDPGARRAAFLSNLARRSGVVVLTGPQGIGKSRLALEAARLHDYGFGWVLRGSSLQALHASLAANEAFERGQEATTEALDAPERARAAWQRLQESPDRWVVILDNLHYVAGSQGVPDWVRAVPEPRDGQLLLVTTNLPVDQLPPHWTVVEVPAPEPEDVQAEIRGVARGSLVLVRGFETLVGHHPDAMDPAWSSTPDDPSVELGASEFWRAAEQVLGAETRGWVQRAAFLPPDELAVVPPDTVEVLLRAGLVTRAGDLTQMHRLVGEAIRGALPPEAAVAAAAWTLTDVAARRHLLRRADQLVVRQLADVLEGSTDGAALSGLAAVQEIYDGTQSWSTFVKAQAHLDQDRPEHRPLVADCLHARARKINQDPKATPEEIQDAIAFCLEAVDLRPEDDRSGRLRHEALRGILIRRAASLRPEHSPLRREELELSMTLLDEGYLERKQLGVEDALAIDRASFNRAGVRLLLAQLPGVDPTPLLEMCREIYGECAAFRRENYGTDNPVTAAAVSGQGSVGYLLVLLGDRTNVSADLKEALTFASEALHIRVRLGQSGDIVKSSDQVARIAALQLGRTDAKEFSRYMVDLISEIRPRLD